MAPLKPLTQRAPPAPSRNVAQDQAKDDLTWLGKSVRWGLKQVHAAVDQHQVSIVAGAAAGGWIPGSADASAELRVRLAPHERIQSSVLAQGGVTVPKVPLNLSASYTPGHGAGAGLTGMTPFQVPLPKVLERLGTELPPTGGASIGLMTLKDPLMGEGVGAFVTGVVSGVIYKDGGLGVRLNISPAWLRGLLGQKVKVGPALSVRVFSPELKPLTEGLFALPDKSLADGGRALAALAGDAARSAGVDQQLLALERSFAAELARHSDISPKFRDAWTQFAQQKLVAALGARLGAASGGAGRIAQMPLKDITSAVVDEAVAQWNSAVELEHQAEAHVRANPRLNEALNTVVAKSTPVLDDIGQYLQRALSTAGQAASEAADSQLAADLTSRLGTGLSSLSDFLFGQGELDPVAP